MIAVMSSSYLQLMHNVETYLGVIAVGLKFPVNCRMIKTVKMTYHQSFACTVLNNFESEISATAKVGWFSQKTLIA
jgi:hypothetical protein